MRLTKLDLVADLADPCSSSPYQKVAAAIAFIRQHRDQQPSLSAVAQHIGLSEHHFQRLFTQWAGISPKRFLQSLTIEHAKANISQTRSLLTLSSDLGLSGPSRLHDLFVSIEGMSPGEFKTGGEGLKIYYGLHETLFGMVAIATTARGICSLQFLEAEKLPSEKLPSEKLLSEKLLSEKVPSEKLIKDQLAQTWPRAALIADSRVTQPLCDRIFSPIATQPTHPLTVLVKGTNFQIQVWRALLQIPPGALTTYQTIASIIDRPTAARAVGTAIGKNPVGYLIPCHRVIRASGEPGGYRWGIDRKQAILGWESAQRPSSIGPFD